MSKITCHLVSILNKILNDNVLSNVSIVCSCFDKFNNVVIK